MDATLRNQQLTARRVSRTAKVCPPWFYMAWSGSAGAVPLADETNGLQDNGTVEEK
jgi:hypothetical protein